MVGYHGASGRSGKYLDKAKQLVTEAKKRGVI